MGARNTESAEATSFVPKAGIHVNVVLKGRKIEKRFPKSVSKFGALVGLAEKKKPEPPVV